MDILDIPRETLGREIGALHPRPGKGSYHGNALFRQVHSLGKFEPEALPEFQSNPELARSVRQKFRFALPPISGKQADGDTFKFLLRLYDGLECESVVIPMARYKTLCVSSQVGCKMACRFCETAQMGFLRHLTAGEIVSQVLTARQMLGEPVSNIVFMGMGEPLDNFDAVVDAIRIISDKRGLSIPLTAITISTVGNIPGIKRLAALASDRGPEGLWRIRLAVSLNAPDDATRSAIMPVNALWPMAELKETLKRWPMDNEADFIFAEYVLIEGVNDSIEHALVLVQYLKDLRTCVNLIPYNPQLDSPYTRPGPEKVKAFFDTLMGAGQTCRIRGTKGDGAMAACGQLGNRGLSRKRPEKLEAV